MEHHYYLLERWVRLAEVVRSGEPVPQPEGGRSPAQLRAFICGMRDVVRRSAETIAAQVDLSDRRRLLDLGGGPATASIVLCRRFARLNAVVFDLPEVVPIAERQIAAAQLADRITTRPGDFLAEGPAGDIGDGYDCVLVSNIIHSLAPEQTARLCAKALAALVPGGLLLIKEFFLADSRTEPSSAALFAVNMLVGTEGGKSYTWSETEAILRSCGAVACERLELPPTSGLLLARKPEI
jgi:cyclopropane fatty-acyl-phospholipid synthase-like methyltransferase